MNVTIQNAQDVMNEIQKRMWDIPFENSQFQTENFILNASLTPERAYRAAALRLQSKLNSLKEAYFNQRRDAVKLKQLKKRLDAESNELEKELIEIDIEELLSNQPYRDKLINDAIIEANQLYNFIQACPEYTREDFENAERTHYEKRLVQEAQGITGALKSLSDMGVDLHSLSSGEIKYIGDGNELQLRKE